jgi:hypothetical protein
MRQSMCVVRDIKESLKVAIEKHRESMLQTELEQDGWSDDNVDPLE